MKKIVIKIGSQVITQGKNLNIKNINNIINDIVNVKKEKYEIIIISSGAVSTGLQTFEKDFKIINNTSKKETLKRKILASVGWPNLMQIYKNKFEEKNIKCAQILVNRSDFSNRNRYLSLREVTQNLLNLNILPIFNENDVLSAEEENFSDNDQLASMIAAMVVADLLIILTDVNGVYNKDPEKKDAKLINEIKNIEEIIENINNKKSEFGRGGMKNKLISAKLITSLGIPLLIANGFRKNILEKIILKNKLLGTFFPASKKIVKPIKSWIKIASEQNGKIFVSTFLADILRNKKTASILLTGIEKQEGNFKKGDVVQVYDLNNTLIGKGQIKYSSVELDNFLKQEKKENKIIIHYDYFIFENK